MAEIEIAVSQDGSPEIQQSLEHNTANEDPEANVTPGHAHHGEASVAESEGGALNGPLPPDEEELHHGKEGKEVPTKNARSIISAGCEAFKYLYSSCLLAFSVIVVMAAIFSEQTVGTEKGVHPAAAFFVFWFLICWLAMMEGGQGALVGLQPIDKSLYAESHPRALKCNNLAHRGDNMDRFIIGRQFLVVLVVFVSNLMASSTEGAHVLGMSQGASEVFLASGFCLILTTIMLGQLTAQINASNCMLDFINNYFMIFTTYVSLFIEFSGLLHSVYLVQLGFSKIAGNPIKSNEPPHNAIQKTFFWFRVLLSVSILGFAFAVTLSALFQGKTTAWEGLPTAVSVIIFFVLMCFAGLMDGMQVALFAVVNIPEEEFAHAPTAKKNCDLTFSGQNLQAFLIGRQICVTICTFVIAKITTLDVDTAENDNIFGVSDGLQEFFNTGLLGAVITTIVASLAWRTIASSFPLAFLSNPLIYLSIRLCLVLEASGICSASWVLAIIHKHIVGYKLDKVYIGTLKEREALKKDVEEGGELELEETDEADDLELEARTDEPVTER